MYDTVGGLNCPKAESITYKSSPFPVWVLNLSMSISNVSLRDWQKYLLSNY